MGYCDIKHRECEDAGSITFKGYGLFGESKEIYKKTICYKKGNWVSCKY